MSENDIAMYPLFSKQLHVILNAKDVIFSLSAYLEKFYRNGIHLVRFFVVCQVSCVFQFIILNLSVSHFAAFALNL